MGRKRQPQVDHKLLLEAVWKSSADAMRVSDLNGTVISVNDAYCTLTGFKESEIVGYSFEIIYEEKERGELLKYYRDFIQSKKLTERTDKKIKFQDGRERYIEASYSGFEMAGERYILCIFRDITEFMNAEEEDRSLRKQLRAVLDAVPSYIFAKDYDGKFLMVNKSLADLFGVSPDEVVGKTDSDYGATKEQIEGYITADREVIDSGKPLLIKEEQVLRKDGSLGWFQTNKVPYMHPGMDRPAILGVAVDITDRKKVETILQESEKRYRTLFDLSPAGIMLLNENGKIIKLNDSILKSLQYTREELLGKDIHRIIPPENYKRADEDIKRILAGETLEYEVINLRKDGSKCFFYLCETSVSLPDERRGILTVVIDVTEKKQAENAIREAMEKAEASDKLKTAFLNNISHELRTPLNGILGFGDLISQPGITEKDKQNFLSYLRSSSARLVDTITDYMDISLLVSNNMKVNMTDFEPEILLNQIAEKNRKLFGKKDINFCCNIPDKITGFILKSDPELIEKIFFQLLSNAAEYTDKGLVEIGLNVKDNFAEFYVKDTGIGIDKEVQKFIFDYFRQESEGIGRFYEGSGLGLSIANKITELLGGRIRLESQKGIGTTFYFSIPLIKDNTIIPSKEFSNQYFDIKNEPVILIVEDEELNRKLLQLILHKVSVKTLLATDGAQAVMMCTEHPEIDLVLMDIKLPVLDGLEATRQIKTFRKDLPVIAVTAYAMIGDEKKAFNAGCNEYITKPIDRELLLSKLLKYGIAICG